VKLNPDQRLAGVLEPVFAIRTEDDLGIGDTDGVRQMIDWCHEHGLSIFQILPINETGPDHSPYNPISSLAIDPVLLAVSPKFLPDLSRAKFNQIARPQLLRQLRSGRVKYAKVKALKSALLQAAFDSFAHRHFIRETPRADEFRKFVLANSAWLADYSLFRILMEENSGQPAWEHWQPTHRTPTDARAWLLSQSEDRRDELERKQLFFMYVQWIAFSQWQALKSYGESKRVWLMGDIPFGVARHSADVWANRPLFDLDWSGGAPPEPFFKNDPFAVKWGQNWGIAHYRWDEMRRHDFKWWRTRVGNIEKVFHIFRIDHAPGFFRIYSFPWTPEHNPEFLPLTEAQAAARTGGRLPGFKPFPDDTHEHKAINQKQGEETLRMVLDAAGDTTVVAEDLGVVPEYMPGVLEKLEIPGFRIPCFFREHDGSFTDPSKYRRLSLAQPATHDHPPLAAAWAEHWRHIDTAHEARNHLRELRHWMDFAGVDEEKPPQKYTDQLREGYLGAVLQSKSWLVVVMITDLFGQTMRFNTPGTFDPDNWALRQPLIVKQLDRDPVLLARIKNYSRHAREANRGLPNT
jgi:4-alpha-glucanotransferase